MKLTVLVPASLVAETDDARAATYKIGQVARAAAIFRCDKVVVFDDGDEHADDGDLVAEVLRYAATPPYLRKTVFDRRDELRYVGVLPPLGTPLHSVTAGPDSEESGPEYREGVVTKVGTDGRVWVNCGTQHPVALRVPDEGIREGERVTLRVSSREPLRAKIADDPPYGGYEVERAPLDGWLGAHEGVVVCASRSGKEVEDGDLRGDNLAVVFGAPQRGVNEILRERDMSVSFDAVVNTLPNQGVETVRTEEAVLATLALVNTANR
ncbi:MAG: putative RNA uridine N3 methyltransferase [Halobacteriales archaeon]